MPRLHREACGAPGCSFVAGPSRDQNRVMRIVDQHRAGHRLEADSVVTFVTRRKTHGKYGMYKDGCRCEPCTAANAAYQRSVWQERPDAVAERKRERDRRLAAELVERRRRQAAARVAQLAAEAWTRTG